MSVKASASVTLAWSAGILNTIRYYQLASPTAATPTVPASSSDLGSWSETEPEADITKVLWTCERTVYADGTESWSKASKSTSYEAAKDAKGTADAANSTAQTAKTTADTAQSTADDAYSRTLRVQISSSPADATGDTSTLTATVWRGGQQLTEQEVAMMGLVKWYVGDTCKATGYTYSCAAGTAVECRLEG